MVINRIHIIRFGALSNREFSVKPGLNIIEGENESGKTTVAAFLRYIFYGIGHDTDIQRFLTSYPDQKQPDTIGGTLDITLSSPLSAFPEITQYRIMRILCRNTDSEETAETCTVYPLYDGQTGDPIPLDTVPGELFFGVSHSVFSASAFVGQVTSSAKNQAHNNTYDNRHGNYTGGSPVRAAIDRILYAANEEIDPDAAIRSLCDKRNALFNPETETGSIRDMERRRAALYESLTAAENFAAEQESNTEETNDAELPSAAEDASDKQTANTEMQEQLGAAAAACEKAITDQETRITRLQKIIEQYHAYRALDDLDSLTELHKQSEDAELRAASLAQAMFRGDYIPDAEFTASLYRCAENMRQAAQASSEADTELERLDFSVRRDNLKEKQMHRLELDGGVEAIRSRLDKLNTKRSFVTIFGILSLLITVFAAAATIFLLILHSNLYQIGMIVTAVLGALAFGFFLSRSRYERGIGVMLERYSCATEDELENFLEEFILSHGKLQSLSENKENLRAKRSALSLQGSEAARQAALLLSKLQPTDAPKITAEHLTPESISTAAERIDRALDELIRLYQISDQCKEQIAQYIEKHGAQDEAALYSRKKALAALFEKNSVPFRIEPIQKELENTQNAVNTLHNRLKQLQNTTAVVKAAAVQTESAPKRTFRRAATCDCGPDPKILRSLIEEMDNQLRRDRKQYAALNLAIDAVQRASITLHQSIAPRLTENAGKLMALLSDYRYSALILDESMHLCAAENSSDPTTGALPIDILSAGTQDLAYLSLRMALLHMLYPKETPPMLFDEAFATLDDKRLSRMIALLHRASASSETETGTSQAIIFTCHKRERRAAQSIADCHVLNL